MAPFAPLAAQQAVPDEKDRQAEPEPGRDRRAPGCAAGFAGNAGGMLTLRRIRQPRPVMPPSKNSGPSKRSARPLALAECEPFARGRRRHCYVHPDDPDLCVKVAADAGDERCLREQGRDLRSYRWLRSLGSDSVFDRIPAVEGTVDTDLGEGIVMRLYRDHDGRISRNLAQVIVERGLTPCLAREIDALKRWLRKERLLTRDTAPYNVVAVRSEDGRWQLMIIEGWANLRYRWLTWLHPLVKDRLIARQLGKFDRRVSKAMKARMRNRTQ